MDIRLNGLPHDAASSSLIDLLIAHAIDLEKPGSAVAINDAIVPRGKWRGTVLNAGDIVEIVKPHSGG